MRHHLKRTLLLSAGISLSALCAVGQDTTLTTTTTTTTTTSVVPSPGKLFSGTQSYRTWSIGVHGGMLWPALAIGGRNDFSKWKGNIGYGFYIKNQLSHNFGLQAEFMRGTVEATNERPIASGAPQQGPYSSFKTDINWSGALTGVLTVGNINWSQMHTAVQPYIKAGAGLINYNPTLVTTTGTSLDYKPNGSITELFIPVGFGFKFNVSNSANLDLGYTMNFVDGDNFDGYFKEPFQGDKFSYAHLGVEFALGNASKPQLATHNAPAQLSRDLMDQNAALRSSLAATEARMNSELGKLSQLDALRSDLDKMKVDSDKDGVPDFFDKCPNTPAGTKVDGSGCPLPEPVKDTTIIKQPTTTYVITEEDKRIVNEAIRNLEFDFGKSTIRARSYPSLNRVAGILVQKGFSLKLAGHTDNVGSDAANMKLSKDRAESVKAYLVSQKANPSRIEAVGYGESQPIETNKTAAGRQKNRRVEFTLY